MRLPLWLRITLLLGIAFGAAVAMDSPVRASASASCCRYPTDCMNEEEVCCEIPGLDCGGGTTNILPYFCLDPIVCWISGG